MKKLFDSEEHSWYRVDSGSILSESKKRTATAFTTTQNLIVLMKVAIVFLGTCATAIVNDLRCYRGCISCQ